MMHLFCRISLRNCWETIIRVEQQLLLVNNVLVEYCHLLIQVFFAEAYTQCGEIGILIFPSIVCFIIGIIEKIANWYGKGVVLVVLVKLYLAMNSTFLLTSLSIIGIIQFIGITWFIKKIWKQGNKNRVTQIEKR